jgi:hypothetical protein
MVPSEGLRDRIHFIINNLARDNVDIKGIELRELLQVCLSHAFVKQNLFSFSPAFFTSRHTLDGLQIT